MEAFALALDIDSWEEAVDLAQRSVPNLRSIGWSLVLTSAVPIDPWVQRLWSSPGHPHCYACGCLQRDGHKAECGWLRTRLANAEDKP